MNSQTSTNFKRFIILASFTFTSLQVTYAQNSVILGDAILNGGHADGGIFIGGNVSGSGYLANQHAISQEAIYVGGNNSMGYRLEATHATLTFAAIQEGTAA